jgi:hypothetical protein
MNSVKSLRFTVVVVTVFKARMTVQTPTNTS